MGSWIDQELAGCSFADERLGKRFGVLMQQLSKDIGRTIPLACGDWAATKAAYRFLDNDRVSEAGILAGLGLTSRAYYQPRTLWRFCGGNRYSKRVLQSDRFCLQCDNGADIKGFAQERRVA